MAKKEVKVWMKTKKAMSWTLDEGESIVLMTALTFFPRIYPHHELSPPLLHVQ
jgi:hypothetical protein